MPCKLWAWTCIRTGTCVQKCIHICMQAHMRVWHARHEHLNVSMYTSEGIHVERVHAISRRSRKYWAYEWALVSAHACARERMHASSIQTHANARIICACAPANYLVCGRRVLVNGNPTIQRHRYKYFTCVIDSDICKRIHWTTCLSGRNEPMLTVLMSLIADFCQKVAPTVGQKWSVNWWWLM